MAEVHWMADLHWTAELHWMAGLPWITGLPLMAGLFAGGHGRKEFAGVCRCSAPYVCKNVELCV